jgi:hypothetical protein
MHLIGAHLAGMCLMGVYLTGVHLMGVYLIDVYFIRVCVPHRRTMSWTSISLFEVLCAAYTTFENSIF